MLTIYVVSDATGATADRLLQAALAQFEGASLEIVKRGQVRTPDEVRQAVRQAADGQSLIIHTMVSDDLRRLMLTEARQRGVTAMDLLGPLLDRLATQLRLAPREKPGLLNQLVEAKSREIEAVDFAFRHDDGRNAHDLERAEIVLVGVSRSMKTPTMLYLAHRGWLAANVPIVLDLPLPEPLLSLPCEKVFCLMLSPERLAALREVRAAYASIPEGSYSSPELIARELLYAKRLALEHGWRSVDVTAKSVEEVSAEIIALLQTK